MLNPPPMTDQEILIFLRDTYGEQHRILSTFKINSHNNPVGTPENMNLEFRFAKLLVDRGEITPKIIPHVFEHNSDSPTTAYNALVVISRFDLSAQERLLNLTFRNIFGFVGGLMREGDSFVACRIKNEQELVECFGLTRYALAHNFNSTMMTERIVKPYPEYRFHVGRLGLSLLLEEAIVDNIDKLDDIINYTRSRGVSGRDSDEVENIISYIHQLKSASAVSGGWL